MKYKTIAGVIALVAVVMGVMFTGCVEDLSPAQIAKKNARKTRQH